jgi:folate-dependent phosphoribosylglycinamide formyltransferase PurN
MRLAILAPTQRSLYSRLVTHLAAQEPGVEVVTILVRSLWSFQRLRSELRRDGPRLLDKVYKKLILGERSYPQDDAETIAALARSVRLPGQTMKDLALRLRVPLVTIRDLNDPGAEAALATAQPDLIAFTGGGLVRENILCLPRLGVLNCHSGILPRYRGMDVLEWPLLEAEDARADMGLTLHLMDRGVDTGPILLQSRAELHPGDTLAVIRTRLEPAMVSLMLNGIRGLRDGSLNPIPQAPEAGRQYFVMHPRLKAAAAERLQRLVAHRFRSAQAAVRPS